MVGGPLQILIFENEGLFAEVGVLEKYDLRYRDLLLVESFTPLAVRTPISGLVGSPFAPRGWT